MHSISPPYQLDMPEVKISSRLVVVGKEPNQTWTGAVTSIVRVGLPESQRSLKWLVVAASILAGLLLLALLCALLWAVSGIGSVNDYDGESALIPF